MYVCTLQKQIVWILHPNVDKGKLGNNFKMLW